MASQSQVRRRTWSCARCRLRKLKCDASSQSCSRCTGAGVACVGLDSVTRKSRPRSLVQYLEDQIATYEKNSPTSSPPSFEDSFNRHLNGILLSPVVEEHGARTSTSSTPGMLNTVIRSFTPSFLGLSESVALARFVVAGTRIPSTDKSFGVPDIDDGHIRSIIHPLPLSNPLQSIPVKVADFLFDNYVSRVLPQYPVFFQPDVLACYNSVFHNPVQGLESGDRASAFDVYVISLVMAISLSTAARQKQARANSIARGLFENAVQRMPTVFANDISGLQSLLLLFQYTFLDPSVANLYFLSGYASQACIDLGLHQEYQKESSVNILIRDIRRRLFWCAWEMDVAVCAGLLRPISILNKYINVSFPTELEDSAISTHGIDPLGRATKFTALRIWTFRQIESEIISILFHNEPIPPSYASLHEWMASREVSIRAWNEEVHRSASTNLDRLLDARWAEMSLYADIAEPYILVTLFRSCPRIKMPTAENLMKAFVAAVKVANGYWEQANREFGSIKYVFHPCHHVFSSATVFLHALQLCKATISSSFSFDEVEGFMASFSRFFSTIAERWPAASRCLEEYERLLAPVKKEYIDYTVQRSRSTPPDPSNLEDLVGLQEDLADRVPSFDPVSYFDLGSLFDVTGTDASKNTFGPYTALPLDWNAEFDLGIDPMF